MPKATTTWERLISCSISLDGYFKAVRWKQHFHSRENDINIETLVDLVNHTGEVNATVLGDIYIAYNDAQTIFRNHKFVSWLGRITTTEPQVL